MAKIIKLYVRPLHSSDLCFAAGGIIEQCSAAVGTLVSRFDFQGRVINSLNGEVDSAGITALIGNESLARLRMPGASAALDQVVQNRRISFLSTYKNIDKIVSAYNSVYGIRNASDPAALPLRLAYIQNLIDQENERARQVGGAIAYYRGIQNPASKPDPGKPVILPDPDKRHPLVFNADGVLMSASTSTVSYDLASPQDAAESSAGTNTTQTFINPQSVTTRFTDLLNLDIENASKNMQRSISYQTQYLAEVATSYIQSDLAEILRTQFSVLEESVRTAQLAFAQRYLTAPIDGRITAIFKETGESVRAGEAVMRIEGSDEVLLVGVVQHRSLILIGAQVQVVVREVFEDRGRATLTGTVVSIRGHDSSNDEWELMIAANNRAIVVDFGDDKTQTISFPINYNFDRKSTEISFP